MAGDLVIEEGDLEVLRDRTRDVASRLQSVSVARRATTSPPGLAGASSRGWDVAPARRSTTRLWQCRVTWMISPSP